MVLLLLVSPSCSRTLSTVGFLLAAANEPADTGADINNPHQVPTFHVASTAVSPALAAQHRAILAAATADNTRWAYRFAATERSAVTERIVAQLASAGTLKAARDNALLQIGFLEDCAAASWLLSRLSTSSGHRWARSRLCARRPTSWAKELSKQFRTTITLAARRRRSAPGSTPPASRLGQRFDRSASGGGGQCRPESGKREYDPGGLRDAGPVGSYSTFTLTLNHNG